MGRAVAQQLVRRLVRVEGVDRVADEGLLLDQYGVACGFVRAVGATSTTCGVIAALMIWRLPKLKADNEIESLVSREFAFLLNLAGLIVSIRAMFAQGPNFSRITLAIGCLMLAAFFFYMGILLWPVSD